MESERAQGQSARQSASNGTASRRTVARRLRKFFAEWTVQLGAGTAELWNRVECRLVGGTPAEGVARHSDDLPPEAMQRHPMQQQPMQQPQKQTTPDKADETKKT